MTDVTVNVRKFDGSLHRSWHCRLVENSPQRIVLMGVFDTEVVHPALGTIAQGTVSYEYYWPGKWFNVFRFHDVDGSVRNYYCNIGMPPTFSGSVLEYVDLDIDIVVWPSGANDVLDEHEFAENAMLYGYPEQVKMSAYEAKEHLLELIRDGSLAGLAE